MGKLLPRVHTVSNRTVGRTAPARIAGHIVIETPPGASRLFAARTWLGELHIDEMEWCPDTKQMASSARQLASASLGTVNPDGLAEYVPQALRDRKLDQKMIPALAKDIHEVRLIESAVRSVPSHHHLYNHDARALDAIPEASVHLIVTSPPYWTLKNYRDSEGQLGHVQNYEDFLAQLDMVWRHCYRVLVAGGRLICNVGDVCLSRRENDGRHTVVPLHASIQEHCRGIGFDNLAPIIWHKISNAAYEVKGGSSFLGKPYEPNAVIKNDIEFILMERKPGGYRAPEISTRILSMISAENYQKWFQQIWTGLPGASTREHPAPYPLELAERLIRMFSFVGDTVLDPFLGTGTTTIAAAKWGRNSIGYEVDPYYHKHAVSRIHRETSPLFGTTMVHTHSPS